MVGGDEITGERTRNSLRGALDELWLNELSNRRGVVQTQMRPHHYINRR